MTKPSIQPFFIFNPDYMSWEDYNGNLAISYGELNIPFTAEDDWKITAQVLTSNTAFSSYPIAHPDSYDSWQKWAKDFTEIVNGQSY